MSANYTPFDVSPDDRRFIMVRVQQGDRRGPAPRLILIENWFEELKQKVQP